MYRPTANELRPLGQGQILLKNILIDVKFSFIAGNEEIVTFLPPPPTPIEIKQRMRLDTCATRFSDINMLDALYVLVSASPGLMDPLITYLQSKEALGMYNGTSVSAFIFPQCKFVEDTLTRFYPSMDTNEIMKGRLLILLQP